MICLANCTGLDLFSIIFSQPLNRFQSFLSNTFQHFQFELNARLNLQGVISFTVLELNPCEDKFRKDNFREERHEIELRDYPALCLLK